MKESLFLQGHCDIQKLGNFWIYQCTGMTESLQGSVTHLSAPLAHKTMPFHPLLDHFSGFFLALPRQRRLVFTKLAVLIVLPENHKMG